MGTSIQIAVPAIGLQPPQWWGAIMQRLIRWSREYEIDLLMAASAMPDDAKNQCIRQWDLLNGKNGTLTHENRNALVGGFQADWLFFIDYDTVPPLDALPRLLAHNHPFVCGVYYHRNSPHAPLVYKRQETGLYAVLTDFEPGTIFYEPGLGTGLGCALIHREVFEGIRGHYRQVMRPDGSRYLVHQADILHTGVPGKIRREDTLYLGGDGKAVYVQKALAVDPALEANRAYPYFDMEHGRTEDLGFCERAERVGYTPKIDTGITCEHWHLFPITSDHFVTLRDEAKLAGVLPSEVPAHA